jgi:predicted RNase H-like nuclease
VAILGIDAAWTNHNPSGVALLSDTGSLIAFAPSYTSFVALADGDLVDWTRPSRPGSSIEEVLTAAAVLAPSDPVDVIAVDMPVATVPITTRRVCDNEVSRKYGGRGCGTHSPSLKRPGPIGADFSSTMAKFHFQLAVHGSAPRDRQYLEVYPHTALLQLMKSDYRVPYKESKRRKYWPDLESADRRVELLAQWSGIVIELERHVGPIALPLEKTISLKPVEDAIDAIVCAWVGLQYRIGQAESLGDETSAIWTPEY